MKLIDASRPITTFARSSFRDWELHHLVMSDKELMSGIGDTRTDDVAGISINSTLKSPRIVVHKTERRLELFSDQHLVKTYRVGLGFSPTRDKEIEGDGATPEGEFYVFVKNIKSAFYLSLGLSYPNAEDAERGLREKLITKAQYSAIISAINRRVAPPQDTKLGGLIYIHGNGSSSDWTRGCVALENSDMKELYDTVEVGTPVRILQ